MHVLTRKAGEPIKIGEDLVGTVLSVRGDQVRLRLLTQRDIHILREAIAQRFTEGQQPTTMKEFERL